DGGRWAAARKISWMRSQLSTGILPTPGFPVPRAGQGDYSRRRSRDIAVQFALQPGLRHPQMTANLGDGYLHDLCRLLGREPAKKAHLDQPRLGGIFLLQ